jgi:hypothetical protein
MGPQPQVMLMETDVLAVAPGGSMPGWVAGTPAGLAALGVVNCMFDLGPNWRDYPILQVVISPVGPSSGFNPVVMSSRDDAVAAANVHRRLGQIAANVVSGNVISAALTTASGSAGFMVRPMGRFLVITLTNADALSALGVTAKVTVVGYPQ